jgi:hypothetical protein
VQAGESSALRTKSDEGREVARTDRRSDKVEEGEEEREDMGRKERSRKAQLLNRARQERGGIITAKYCTNCLKDKPLDSYSKEKKALFERCPHCRLCRSHLQKDRKLDAQFKSAEESDVEESDEEEEEGPVLSAKAHFVLPSVL